MRPVFRTDGGSALCRLLSKSAVRTSPTPMQPAPTMVPGEKGALTGQSAAAAQLASAQPGSTMQPKTGNPSAAPPVVKPSPSSLSKGKSGRGGQHQVPSTDVTRSGPNQSTMPSSSNPQLCLHLHLPLHVQALMVLELS